MPTATKIKVMIEPTRKEIVLPELERIRQSNGGVLVAEHVIQEAESEDSPLHPYFQWDDTEAAHEYRLWQARQLITAMVTVIPTTNRTIIAYVSLRDDRQLPEGGYRALVDVMSNKEQREALLREALDDLKAWEQKYRLLTELAPVFEAAGKVRRRGR